MKIIFEITINGNIICKRYWELNGEINPDTFVKTIPILMEEFNTIVNTNKKIIKKTFTNDISVYFKTKEDVLFHHTITSNRSNYKINIKHRLEDIRTVIGAEKFKNKRTIKF